MREAGCFFGEEPDAFTKNKHEVSMDVIGSSSPFFFLSNHYDMD